MMKFLATFLILWMSALPVAQAINESLFEQPLLESELLDGGSAIQSYCFSSLFLDPAKPFEEITELYEHRQNCLFASAYKEFVNKESETMQEIIDGGSVGSGYEFDTVVSDLSQCDLTTDNIFSNPNTLEIQEEILKQQTVSGKINLQNIAGAQNGPDFCSTGGDNAGKDYSFCNVAMATHNELCAFQEYAAIKLRNEIFIKDCEGDRLVGNRVDCINRSKALLNRNLVSAVQIKESRLKTYQTRTEDTYLHLLLVVFQEQLENVSRGLDLVRIAFEKWPSKFHDAASQKAGSLLSK